MAFRHTLTPVALALATLGTHAQTAEPQRIVITGRSEPALPDVAGFGPGVDALTAPLAVRTVDDAALRDRGVRSLAELARLDAGVSDSYNAEGYWSQLSMRGFRLDNRANYRRDGLPINAQTALLLDNKSRLEVLKGTSGMQAGTSAPGGLVNLAVKRPVAALASGLLSVRDHGGVQVAADWSRRLGDAADGPGLRVNAMHERLSPALRDTKGERWLLALAADTRLPGGALLEAEAEVSHQRQPSQSAFSLLGNVVPDARRVDPRLNLNNQPWSLPVVMDGRTASLRWTQPLADGWSARIHAMAQRLRSDDRIAFEFGCSADGNFDRYCADGSMDVYDFRSDGERRRSDALDAQLSGRLQAAGALHHVSAGVLATRFSATLPPQAFNFAGVGRVDGSVALPAAPLPLSDAGGRRERSTELYLRDRVQPGGAWSAATLWFGLRHTRLDREARQSFTTPWLALGWRLAEQTHAYASWGQGVETEVAPDLPLYSNAGRPLPALKSRQAELGLRHAQGALEAAATLFSTTRPYTGDSGTCDVDASCTRTTDGSARHRGLEVALGWRSGPWRLQGSALALHARREGAADPALNGLAPVNVPARSLRAELQRALGDDVQLLAALVHEGDRAALPDHSAFIPGWTRLDLGLRAEQRWGATRVTWRAAIDNATDRRAWREAPYEFGHAYLYPLAPRSLRLTAQFQI